MNVGATSESSNAQVDATTITDGEPTDADLIAAAQAVGGAASVDVNAEAAAAGTPPPEKINAGATTTEKPEGATEEPKILAVVKAREKAYAERVDAENYATQRRQQAEEEAAQILANARSRAASDYEADLAARRARFQEAPAAAIRELGFKTDDVADAVMREGTPEWKEMRRLQQQLVETQKKAGTADAVRADFDAFKNEIQAERTRSQLQAVEHQFLAVHASPEKTPVLHRIAASIPNIPGTVRGPAAVVAWGHALAAEWRQAGIPFAHSDVAEYLEHQARNGTLGAGATSPPPQVSGTSGAPKVRANGSRTLSAATGSERRASPKPIDDMSPEEERQALIEAAAEARRTIGT